MWQAVLASTYKLCNCTTKEKRHQAQGENLNAKNCTSQEYNVATSSEDGCRSAPSRPHPFQGGLGGPFKAKAPPYEDDQNRTVDKKLTEVATHDCNCTSPDTKFHKPFKGQEKHLQHWTVPRFSQHQWLHKQIHKQIRSARRCQNHCWKQNSAAFLQVTRPELHTKEQRKPSAIICFMHHKERRKRTSHSNNPPHPPNTALRIDTQDEPSEAYTSRCVRRGEGLQKYQAPK